MNKIKNNNKKSTSTYKPPLPYSSFLHYSPPTKQYPDKEVKTLAYEAYIPMAEKSIQSLITAARQKWDDLIHVAIVHKIGDCPVGETSVVIAVSSGHRVQGLEAVHWLIDELKVQVPIWKKEVYTNGGPDGTDGGEVWKANNTLP
jgi:molybdopterin synthase catalytic subunit